MRVLAQANELLTSSNSVFMVQVAKMTMTMDAMQAELKALSLAPTNPTKTIGSITVRVLGANILMGVKHTQPIKRSIIKRNNTISNWEEVKSGTNSG